jgi:hypothetical protein
VPPPLVTEMEVELETLSPITFSATSPKANVSTDVDAPGPSSTSVRLSLTVTGFLDPRTELELSDDSTNLPKCVGSRKR